MRDPKRIDAVLSELEKYWKTHPDLRLGQIVCNFGRMLGYNEPFFVEDDKMLMAIIQANTKIGFARIEDGCVIVVINDSTKEFESAEKAAEHVSKVFPLFEYDYVLDYINNLKPQPRIETPE